VKTMARRTRTQTNCTGVLLTKMRSSGTAPIRRRGGDGAGRRRGPRQRAAAARTLGLGVGGGGRLGLRGGAAQGWRRNK
jgi:hypothetical protein